MDADNATPILTERQRLLRQLDQAVERLIETVYASTTPEALIIDAWTAKDVLGHLTFWHTSFARVLSALVEGRKPDVLKGKYVDLNQRSVEEAHPLTTDQLVDRLRSAHAVIQQHILSPTLTLIPYRKGTRDYTPEEHLRIVHDHILGHLREIEKAQRKANLHEP